MYVQGAKQKIVLKLKKENSRKISAWCVAEIKQSKSLKA